MLWISKYLGLSQDPQWLGWIRLAQSPSYSDWSRYHNPYYQPLYHRCDLSSTSIPVHYNFSSSPPLNKQIYLLLSIRHLKNKVKCWGYFINKTYGLAPPSSPIHESSHHPQPENSIFRQCRWMVTSSPWWEDPKCEYSGLFFYIVRSK